ncbi:MAG: NAD-dependent protein deacylase [Lachnospiraceae bacterium]|nr:NAD-dependent protein deacylase [Lachnospiraceae bacterium]
MTEEEKISRLNEMIKGSDNIVFFGGAGVSTESGIPDFRSVDGLYHQQYDYPPEEILSHTFYMSRPEEFFRFYKNKILLPAHNAKPNKAHLKLAQWSKEGKLRAIVTQNIDGLHQAAAREVGAPEDNILELHGSTLRNYCESCHAFYDVDFMRNADGVPRCTKCGGRIKPDVVLYEEGLNMDTLNRAVRAISEADVLIIGGTSLVVYPAAGLIDYYRGDKLVLINKSSTSRDAQADLVIDDSIGKVLGALD